MNYEPGTYFQIPNRSIVQGLPAISRSVYMTLCDMSDPNGLCWPSNEIIGELSGCSLASARRALNELVRVGLIDKVARVDDRGQTSNKYQLKILAPRSQGAPPPAHTDQRIITNTNNNHIAFSVDTLKEASPSKPEPLQGNSTNDLFEMMGLEQIDIEDALPAVDTLTTGKAITPKLGDPKINKILASFEGAVGIKLNRVKQQRYAAKRLLDRYGEETVHQAIKAAALVRQEEYAPMILNLEDLWNKWDKLATFYQRKQHEQETQKQGVSVITEG